jgi:hypothetical protein
MRRQRGKKWWMWEARLEARSKRKMTGAPSEIALWFRVQGQLPVLKSSVSLDHWVILR